jgi:hypothetical protein
MTKRIGKDSLTAAPKPSAAVVAKFAAGQGSGKPAPKEKKPQGVKVTIYLEPEVEQKLRLFHAAKPATDPVSGQKRGYFYEMLVELMLDGLAAKEKGRHAA